MANTMPQKRLADASVVVGASQTAAVVSDVFTIGDDDSERIRVDITASSVTSTTGITVFLQDSSDGGTVWNTASQTTAITGNGLVTVTLNPEVAGDVAFLPLRPRGRVVVTTGVGDAATIDSVRVSRRKSP